MPPAENDVLLRGQSRPRGRRVDHGAERLIPRTEHRQGLGRKQPQSARTQGGARAAAATTRRRPRQETRLGLFQHAAARQAAAAAAQSAAVAESSRHGRPSGRCRGAAQSVQELQLQCLTLVLQVCLISVQKSF